MNHIFVGGSQRSGTTLLNKFLCLDQHTNSKIAEASYLRELMTAYKNALLDFDHDTADYFDDTHDLKQFHSSIINLFLHRCVNRLSNNSRLVLKEPHLTQLFPELFDLVPHSLFILIARDPRDIISSMLQVGERMKAQGQSHFFQQRNIELLCQHILSFYAPSLNYQNEGFRKRLMIIKYEDLILDTTNVQTALANFTQLDLNFDSNTNPNESMLGKKSEKIDPDHPGKKRYQAWITPNNSKTINDSSIESYKHVLSKEEIIKINHHMKSYMDIFDYEY